MIPASIRTNNPGAMYPGPSAKKFGSTKMEILKSKDGTHKIACFDDPVQGAAAQFHLLSSPKYTGRSIRDAITKWCGGFYASTYIKVLEQNGGVTADTMLTADLLRDPQVAIPLAKAMALQEAGRTYPMTDEQWQKAHELCFGAPIAVAQTDAPKTAEPAAETFTPDNPLPSPKPETRVTSMKTQSRKWNVITFIKRWLVGVPALGLASSESGVPVPDIPALQENLNAVQSVFASVGKLGLVGWLIVIFVGLQLVQGYMVEDATEGRSTPSGGA